MLSKFPSHFIVVCTLCCQFLWIVHFLLLLRLVYPILPVYLDCPFLIAPSSCVPYVASLSGLSMFDWPFVLCTLCCQFLWIVHVWLSLRLVYPMLPVSLDCPCLIAPSSCVPYVASFSGLSMFERRDNQTWTIQRNWQHRVHKTKGQSNMDNPEKLATYGTQDEGAIKHGQSRDTGNIGYTRRRDNQTWTIQRNWQHMVHKTKGQSNMDNPEKLAT
jgi:hypothetical protein